MLTIQKPICNTLQATWAHSLFPLSFWPPWSPTPNVWQIDSCELQALPRGPRIELYCFPLRPKSNWPPNVAWRQKSSIKDVEQVIGGWDKAASNFAWNWLCLAQRQCQQSQLGQGLVHWKISLTFFVKHSSNIYQIFVINILLKKKIKI